MNVMFEPNDNQLNINNPESVFLFGNDIQTQINGYTKTISEIILCDQGNAGYLLIEMDNSISNFERTLEGAVGFWKTFINGKSNIKKDYTTILSNINKLELALKLQEAKLIKDIEVFKRIKPLMEEAETKLGMLLDYGNQTLNSLDKNSINEDQQFWMERLDKRLLDLNVSRTIILQTIRQVELLMNNDIALVDKLIATLGTTIPVWRTQVSLLLGIERQTEQSLLQNKIAIATESYAKENASILKKEVKKAKRKKEVDIEGIKKLNESFIKDMNYLSSTEQENEKIVGDTKNIILKV